MDFYKSEETYLAHYGVMGMKWGVRKSIRKLNSYGNRSSRYGKKIQKKIKKYNKLMAKSYKFKSKGKLAESFEKESKAFKTSRKATKLVKKQEKNLKRYEETRKYIEKSFSTSLKKINKGKIDKSTPYNIGQLMSVKIKSIPKVTYNIKKDKVRSNIDLNKMDSKSFYNYINSSRKGSLPVSIDRTDYIYKKAGVKKKKVGGRNE